MRSVDKHYYQLSYNEKANLHYLSSETFKCESESEWVMVRIKTFLSHLFMFSKGIFNDYDPTFTTHLL